MICKNCDAVIMKRLELPEGERDQWSVDWVHCEPGTSRLWAPCNFTPSGDAISFDQQAEPYEFEQKRLV